MEMMFKCVIGKVKVGLEWVVRRKWVLRMLKGGKTMGGSTKCRCRQCQLGGRSKGLIRRKRKRTRGGPIGERVRIISRRKNGGIGQFRIRRNRLVGKGCGRQSEMIRNISRIRAPRREGEVISQGIRG